MKLGIVIVSYGDHSRLYKHLDLLKDQVPDTIFIINTGPGPVKVPKMPCEVILKDFDNIGPAGGFNEGGKLAVKTCDYVVFADDDAYPTGNTVERLKYHIKEGSPAIAGFYPDGTPIELANHYFMVKKEILLKLGFHHAPFFMMFEDEEFFKRVNDVYHVKHDKNLIINHATPFFIVDPYKAHLFFRNGLISHVMRNDILGFIIFFSTTFYQALFFLFFLGKTDMLQAHFAALLNFLFERMGNVKTKSKYLLPENQKPDDNAIFVANNPTKSDYEIFNRRLPSLPFLGVRPYMDYVRKTAVKDVIVRGQLRAAYMPYPLFSKRVFLYFVKNNEIHFFYRPNTLLYLFFLIAFILIPTPPIAFILFFLKYNYRKTRN